MRYTGVRVTSEPKVTGLKNSTVSLQLTESTKAALKPWTDREYVLPPDDFSFRNISPPTNVELIAEMVSKAKVMDFMSFSPYLIPTNKIISQRAADFLAGQKMMACELVPIKILNNATAVPGTFYVWINHKIRPELLDMEHSVVRSGIKNLSDQYHQVKDTEAYWQLVRDTGSVTFIKTKFKNASISPDCMWILGDEIYVSEKFWKEYQQAGLIGLGLIRKELELME